MYYAKPNTPTPEGITIPRTLTPLSKTASSVSSEPSPTSDVQSREFSAGWVCSTHVFRAASPRESPSDKALNTPKVEPLTGESTKAERQARVDSSYDRIMAYRNAIASGQIASSNDDVLWSVANRYVRTEPPNNANQPAITLVAAHATGFHKEIWETTFRYIISSMESSHRLDIDEIWAIDAVNHGDSALMNQSKYSDVFEWSDHSRDILNFMVNYLPNMIAGGCDPTLSQVPEEISRHRLENGFDSRVVVGLGHSFGGCTLMRTALHAPRLFSSLIMVDPVMYPSYAFRGQYIGQLIKGALSRRDQWPDREAAKAGLLKSPFFKAWHPDVLSDYLKFGIYECQDGVRLKCSGHQEGVTFGECSRLPSEVWGLLPSLDERIPIRWIMDSTNASATAGEEITQRTVWRRPANSSNIRLMGAGHLIPQEAPQRLAHEIIDFVRQKHGNGLANFAVSKL